MEQQGDAEVEQAADLPGTQDGFERLWTPHRMAYVKSERPSDQAGEGCPFCAAPAKDDETGLIVHRGEHCYVVLNLFPYNPGHLLICPYRHVADLTELTTAERDEVGALSATAMTVKPSSFSSS